MVRAENLSKKFCKSLKRSLWYGIKDIANELRPWRTTATPTLRPGEFWALRDVSFAVRPGEALGVIGPNGAGKSTLLKMLSGLIKPDAGGITVQGRVGALLELGTGFSPVLTGRENVYTNAAILGLSRREVDAIFDQIVDFAELWEFIDTPVQSYSTGMRVRLGYAVASHLKPDVLLVDEVLAVGDQAFRRKCIQHMQRYLRQGGALVFVSHDMYLLQSFCTQGLFINQGRVEAAGTAVEAVRRYYDVERASHLSEQEQGEEHALNPKNPVIIDSLDIEPLQSEDIISGSDVQITIRYRSLRTVEDAYCSFLIWTADQWVCITGGGIGFGNTRCHLSEGKGQLRCIVPNLSLNNGTYALKAVIGARSTYVPLARFGWENAPSFFEVKAATAELDNLYSISATLVRIETRWVTEGQVADSFGHKGLEEPLLPHTTHS